MTKRFGLYIIILYMVSFLTGCHDTLVLPIDPIPVPRTEAERTVIIYMAADNSLSSAARKDTIEMALGKNKIPDDVNFIIYIDDTTGKPAIYELSRGRGIKLWKQYEEELCSTKPEVMLEALSEIVRYFPARHYGITFWSHATGWAPEQSSTSSTRRKTFGQDDEVNSTDSPRKIIEMEIPVLRDVLAQLPKFDYIFFDACFMQCIEVAYELRNVTNWMIGSPAEIPGPGAPYDKVIEALCKGDVKGIVQGYDSGYPLNVYSGVLLSCIDCTQLEALAEATGGLLTHFYMERDEPLTTNFQFYCDISFEKFTYCFDMRTTMFCLLSAEQYAVWMEAFDKAVPLRTLSVTNRWFARNCDRAIVTNPECYGGVSMFVPMAKYDTAGCNWNTDFRNTSWYTATGWQATGW